MSDDTDIQAASPADPSATPAPTGIKGFFKTTLGRVLMIGCAVITLLTVIGVVITIVLGATLWGEIQKAVDGGAVVATVTPAPGAEQGQPGSVEGSGSAEASPATPAGVPDVDLDSVYIARNPFEPVPLPETAVESSGSGTVNDDILVLEDIVTQDGVRKAVFSYNGTRYTVGAGGTVDATPWKVVRVNSSSVDMLYGDDRVTLSLGQGIGK